MATDLQRLVVSLEARTAAFEKAINRANGVTNRQARAIESRFAQMNKRVSASLAATGKGWVAGIAAGIGAREVGQLLDAATKIDNALKVAGLSGAELEKVYGRLRDSAIDNAAPLESLVELYGRASLVQKELGITGEELLGFTDKIAVALRVSGQSAAASSGALLQLSQALGSGTVRAEEFNSILEGALPIAQAAAAGLREAGGSVAKLRQLVVDGKVSSEAFFRAFEAGAPMLEDKVANAVLTIDQRMTNLRTALIDAAKRFNNSTQAANTFGSAIDNVANFVNGIDFDSLISEITAIIDAFRSGIQWANNFASSVGEATGLDGVGDYLTGGAVTSEPIPGLTITSQRALRNRIDQGFAAGGDPANSALEEQLRQIAGGGIQSPPPRPATPFTPVSLADFAPPVGTKDKKTSQNDLQREIEQIRERTALLQAETAAQAGLNPLVNDYEYTITKATATQELLNAAKEAGITITPELTAQIGALAEGYARATAEANMLAESQARTQAAAEDMRALGRDVLGGFIQDLRSGVTAAEALQNALSKVADKLLEVALNSIFEAGGAGGFGDLLGGIGSIFGFADGGIAKNGKPLKTFARGGVSRSAAIFGEAGAEAAVPLPDGRSIPVDLRVPQVGAAGGGNTTNISMPVNINAPGADPAALARVREEVVKLQKSIPQRVDQRINDRQVRKTRA